MPTALVTGASRGLGLALAHALAAEGWALLIDARGEEELRLAAARISASFPAAEVRAVPGDVADPRHRERLREAAESLGGLDLVVSNGGTLGPSPLPQLLEVAPVEVARTVATNAIANLALVQSVAVPTGARTLVLVSSDAAVAHYPGWGVYGASKAALEHIGLTLAAEREDLTVYVIDPGDLRTQMHQEAFPGEDISDRPAPETVIPHFLGLLEQRPASGRYRLQDIAPVAAMDQSTMGGAA